VTVSGRPERHIEFFSDGNIPDIINMVLSAWKTFDKPDSNDIEVRINRRFREALRRECHALDLPFYVAPPEQEVNDPLTGNVTGRIDIALHNKFYAEENVYFAFECKRLNVMFKSVLHSQAGKYVGDDGMMCFITGKYSAGLPAGGMIGYVMDGNVVGARKSVAEAIERNGTRLRLQRGTGLQCCRLMPRKGLVKETSHDLFKRAFIIYHIFLKV
jgi:hypothetical protein